ncbi:MAG: hypothetical protein Kow0092_06360 [Deferrisomatales bacterium]
MDSMEAFTPPFPSLQPAATPAENASPADPPAPKPPPGGSRDQNSPSCTPSVAPVAMGYLPVKHASQYT